LTLVQPAIRRGRSTSGPTGGPESARPNDGNGSQDRGRDTEDRERNRQPIGAAGQAGEQEDDAKADLECTTVLQKVLVVRLEPGDCLEE